MSVQFEEITKETLYIALEIINSNPSYNVLENGTPEELEQIGRGIFKSCKY